MNYTESASISNCAEQVYLAERELSAFMAAVAELFGPEQARLAGEEWLHASHLIENPVRSTSRDWRAVTIAASARLAHCLETASHHRAAIGTSQWGDRTNTKVQLLSSPLSDVIAASLPGNR